MTCFFNEKSNLSHLLMKKVLKRSKKRRCSNSYCAMGKSYSDNEAANCKVVKACDEEAEDAGDAETLLCHMSDVSSQFSAQHPLTLDLEMFEGNSVELLQTPGYPSAEDVTTPGDSDDDLNNLRQSLNLLPHSQSANPEESCDWMHSFVDVLHEYFKKSTSKSCSFKDLPQSSVTSSQIKIPADPWSCAACHSVLLNPVTLPCGHSKCKKCVIKKTESAKPACDKCKVRLKVFAPPMIKVNVLVNDLVSKFWASELEAIELRNEGNELFRKGKYQKAIEVYDQAFKLDPRNHFLLGNRSHAFFKLGLVEKALLDGEEAIKLKPDWPKGYFRKAMALQKLSRHTETFISLYQCLILEEENVKAIKMELVNTLKMILRANRCTTEDELEDHSSPDPNSLESKPAHSNPDSGVHSEFIDKIIAAGEGMKKLSQRVVAARPIPDKSVVGKDDFECPLCFRLFYRPVTTPCGHTFCKMCLDRILDHSTACPMCKGSLVQHLADRREVVDEFVEESIHRILPEEAEKREKHHLKEMSELTGQVNEERTNETPVFVCTMTFPNIPCPLHVFEPRYRLMIRRCMETGTREFGMCCYVDEESPFADYGTMLEIRDIQYFPDGRAVVDTVGGRRFRVLSRGMRDGYNTAKVEFIKDVKISPDDLEELKVMHDSTYNEAIAWFDTMSKATRDGILKHYGQIPKVEQDYWENPHGPSWIWWIIAIMPLDPKGQLQIHCQTNLKKRLEGIQRIIRFITKKNRPG